MTGPQNGKSGLESGERSDTVKETSVRERERWAEKIGRLGTRIPPDPCLPSKGLVRDGCAVTLRLEVWKGGGRGLVEW